MRVRGWFFLVIGVACLVGAGVSAILAIQQGSELSAYHHARACPAGTPATADCLQTVDGTVAGITESPGDPAARIPAEYALEVQTASTTLHLTFSSDSPMLSYAVNGDPAVVTMWRGVPVSVLTDGRSDFTTSVPDTALGSDLRHGAEAGVAGVFFVLVAVAIRRNRRAGATHALTRPALAASTPLRTRMRPGNWAGVLGAFAGGYLPMLLGIAVLFGVAFTVQDGPPARAFRHAPACVGETNLATCVGDFTAVINGVRSPANGANGADVSYVTYDGAINTWANFGGDTAVIVRMASADESARTQLRIRVWRGSIIGAELGGSWHWTWGNPPGDTVPAAFLAVSFALLLLIVRLRIHSQSGSEDNSERLLTDDLCQVAAAAGSVVLLAYGFWAGAIPALAVLLWLGLSARQSAQRWRVTLAGRLAS